MRTTGDSRSSSSRAGRRLAAEEEGEMFRAARGILTRDELGELGARMCDVESSSTRRSRGRRSSTRR
jgi:hypothetical protein